jgi:type I restriction enzyme R subunit
MNGELIELIDSIRREKEQTIDHDNLDQLLHAGWNKEAAANAKPHPGICRLPQGPHRPDRRPHHLLQPTLARRELSFALIRQVFDKLKADQPKLAPLRVWQAYQQLDSYNGAQPEQELTALVALIRRVCGLDGTLTPFDDTVRRNFQNWIMQHHAGGTEKFNEEQMNWLRMLRDHISHSFHVDRSDLEMSPFDARAGWGRCISCSASGWKRCWMN